jgi:hypothetical protein
MNIEKYYDADGNATHYVCRVLLSFQNNATPWMERVADAAKHVVGIVPGAELQFMNAKLMQSDYSSATVWLMMPVAMPVGDCYYHLSQFANNLGIARIIATMGVYSLDFLTSRNLDQQ